MLRISSFGKTGNEWRDDYIRRAQRIISIEWKEIPLKPSPDHRPAQLIKEEKAFLEENRNFWILDPDGKEFHFDDWRKLILRQQNIHLVIGPAVGFHKDFKEKAAGAISLGPMTFTHELSQVIVAEIIYRVLCAETNHPFVK